MSEIIYLIDVNELIGAVIGLGIIALIGIGYGLYWLYDEIRYRVKKK